MRVLVTGASGFISGAVCSSLARAGHEVVGCSRSKISLPGICCVRAPELGPDADWRHALINIDAVVHLAGLANVVGSDKRNSKAEKLYYLINSEGTRRLAEQCAETNVKHFIFLSSCHALAGDSGEILSAETIPRPVTAYGRSKLCAEVAIARVLLNTDCAWTILRPPLVYGRGNKANFGLLLKLVKSGIPLPMGSIRNRRSFIYVENLADLIVTCVGNANSFGKTYLPSDGENVSTPELISAIANANQCYECSAFSKIGRERSNINAQLMPNLFPFPEIILKALGCLPGFGALRKLSSSLYVDSESIRKDLGWIPEFSLEEGLRRTLK